MSDVVNAEVKAMKEPGGLGGLPRRFTNAIADEREITRTGKPLDRGPVTVPVAPPGLTVDQQMKEATRHGPVWLINQARDAGGWNYKSQGHQYEPYGNFLFGAAGTAQGLPRWVLERGSGAYQIYKDAKRAADKGEFRINLANGVPWGDYPYGDYSDDPPKIERGIRYAKERGF